MYAAHHTGDQSGTLEALVAFHDLKGDANMYTTSGGRCPEVI